MKRQKEGHPRQRKQPMQRWRQAVQGGRHVDFEKRVTKCKGGWRSKPGLGCNGAFNATSRNLTYS